ncbi:MAG TPA: ribonuclease HI [Terriglobia bacterium]|nr:ribonuclease HI [Terriglobia bacterium]
MHEVLLITDGSCPMGNPGPGGWAAILQSNQHERVISGSHPATTNNRMELAGAIEGLRVLKTRCLVTLVTDSMYVKQGITEWLPKWQTNGFKAASGRPVLNQDLWEQLDQLVRQHEVHWEWTRSHSDHALQNRADALAAQAARQQAAALARG